MFRTNKNNTSQKDATSSLSTLQYLRVEPKGSRFTRYKAAAAKKPLVSTFMILVGVLFVAASTIVPHMVRADSISDQISQLQKQNASNQNAVTSLQNEAVSYQDAINRLQGQITLINGEIANNTAKQKDIQGQIDANIIELDKQKHVLGENIKMTYVDGQPSTIEMLASSKNLSDFVDKEEYRTAVQNKIQATLKKIAELQNKLNTQNQQIKDLLAEQSKQQAQLSSARAEQANLLAYNESQQATYNNQTKANQAKIDSLIAQQARANSSGRNGAIIAGASSYPYANWGFSMSTAPGCNDNDGPDAWGYCTRQCVSYAAWAVAHSGRAAPKYYGNAADWVSHALSDGVPVYSFNNVDGYRGVRIGMPQPGDVAISTSGTWGHAMYIEQVSGTQIYVSQYNANLTGEFSHQWRDASNYYFLRFP